MEICNIVFLCFLLVGINMLRWVTFFWRGFIFLDWDRSEVDRGFWYLCDFLIRSFYGFVVECFRLFLSVFEIFFVVLGFWADFFWLFFVFWKGIVLFCVFGFLGSLVWLSRLCFAFFFVLVGSKVFRFWNLETLL